MKIMFIENFNINLSKYMPQLQNKFSFEISKITKYEYLMKNDFIILRMGLYNSHKINISTSFELVNNKNKRIFGLNLIMKVLKPDFDLGIENIKNLNELEFTLKQHITALLEHCSELLLGDLSKWVLFEKYADKKFKKKIKL